MQRSMTGARPKSCALKILWAIAIIAPAPLTHAYGQDSPPALPAKPVMPTFPQHFKAGPYPIMPIADPARDSANKPYRKDAVSRWNGVESSVYNSTNMVKIGGGYDGAGSAKDGFVDVTRRSTHFLVKAVTAYENTGGWNNGHGKHQRFGYDRHSEQLVLGYFPKAGQSLKLIGIHDSIDDHLSTLGGPSLNDNKSGINLIRGDGMDAVKTDRTLGKLVYDQKFPSRAIEKIQLEAGVLALDRVANNFKLRPNKAANYAQGEVTLRRYFAKSTVEFDTMGAAARIGLGVEYTNHDAERLGGPGLGGLKTVSAYQFPDVHYVSSKLDAEAAYDLSADSHILAAMRYEYVQTSADQLYAKTTNAGTFINPRTRRPVKAGNTVLTSQQLYEQYYGAGLKNDSTDHNVSVSFDYTHDFLNDRMAVTGSVGRIMRSGNTQEKYFAAPSTDKSLFKGLPGRLPFGTSARTVGNPQIKPEIHHRIALGWSLKGQDWSEFAGGRAGADAWRLSVDGSFDRVNDFISRDRARKQNGILRADNATIYRNVNADLARLAADAQWNVTGNVATRVNLSFDWGHNRTDGRALYGVAPFETNWLVDYHDDLSGIGTWHTGTKLRMVAGQGRADTDPSRGSGYDSAKTSGFSVLDLYAGAQIYDRVSMTAGIDNVFDKRYAVHHVVPLTGTGAAKAVDAPGRTFFVRATASF